MNIQIFSDLHLKHGGRSQSTTPIRGSPASDKVAGRWPASNFDASCVAASNARSVHTEVGEVTVLKTYNPSAIAAPFGHYDHGVEAVNVSRLLHISGQVGVDPDGSVPATVEAQIERVWFNIEAVLAAAEMSAGNIVRTITYMLDAAFLGHRRIGYRWGAAGFRRLLGPDGHVGEIVAGGTIQRIEQRPVPAEPAVVDFFIASLELLDIAVHVDQGSVDQIPPAAVVLRQDAGEAFRRQRTGPGAAAGRCRRGSLRSARPSSTTPTLATPSTSPFSSPRIASPMLGNSRRFAPGRRSLRTATVVAPLTTPILSRPTSTASPTCTRYTITLVPSRRNGREKIDERLAIPGRRGDPADNIELAAGDTVKTIARRAFVKLRPGRGGLPPVGSRPESPAADRRKIP